jgi:ribosomal protein S18 acetylase RimI-like enzyme
MKNHHCHEKHYRLRQVLSTDVPTCSEYESQSYPIDEMTSFETLLYRQQNATAYFYVLTTAADSTGTIGEATERGDPNNNIIGFVCGTRCDDLTHESMFASHVEGGRYLAIHSVVIKSTYRCQKLATYMLQQYIQAIIKQQHKIQQSLLSSIKAINLLSKLYLLGFYVQNGFQVKYVVFIILLIF